MKILRRKFLVRVSLTSLSMVFFSFFLLGCFGGKKPGEKPGYTAPSAGSKPAPQPSVISPAIKNHVKMAQREYNKVLGTGIGAGFETGPVIAVAKKKLDQELLRGVKLAKNVDEILYLAKYAFYPDAKQKILALGAEEIAKTPADIEKLAKKAIVPSQIRKIGAKLEQTQNDAYRAKKEIIIRDAFKAMQKAKRAYETAIGEKQDPEVIKKLLKDYQDKKKKYEELQG
ncbi:hypothetical protein ACFL35_17805 [Candidatus Riflebacteria bacterium]